MKDDLRLFISKLNAIVPFSGSLKFDEPMFKHTTFKTGGPADLYVKPSKKVFLPWVREMLGAARTACIPVFIIGGGANLLVSDRGIRGIVLDTGAWKGVTFPAGNESGNSGFFAAKVLSGTTIDKMTDTLAAEGLSGAEFLAGMPGTAGGAVWMNARCYEKSVSDILIETEILDENLNTVVVPFNENDFSYKKSPFQSRNVFIISASIKLTPQKKNIIKKLMKEHRKDRKSRGHYRFPSAGSVFKNNHAFGAPTGKIIDELGLKGLCRGGAMVAPWHGNFIINNRGKASSQDIRALIEEIKKTVLEKRGFNLEPEILFVGDLEGI